MKPPIKRATIYVDLDDTLIWTWEPLITSAFMSAAFGLPICTPPKPGQGNRRIVKVPIGDKFALSCCRPNVKSLLRDLRRLAEVRLLTHAHLDYALAMNMAFGFGFSQQQIFSLSATNRQDEMPPRTGVAVLIDDNGSYSGDEAWKRHREKCAVIGVEQDSFSDIQVTPFTGRQNDLFARPLARRSIRSIMDRVQVALDLRIGNQQLEDAYLRIHATATGLVGNKQDAHNWIVTPCRALGRCTPLSKFGSEAGVSEVMAVLHAVEEKRQKYLAALAHRAPLEDPKE